MACAHFLLDTGGHFEIHLISKSFEIGLMGETPGLLGATGWPKVRPHWLSEGGLDTPTEESTAVRASWLAKSMAISLSDRGASFHTGSRVISDDKEGRALRISVPGEEGSAEIQYDVFVGSEKSPEAVVWKGAVTLSPPETTPMSGRRPDGTYESWWRGEGEPRNPLQLMTWEGEDPSSALDESIGEASRASDNILSGSLPA
tara:strand:- start:2966 stop:3571 length:606 start_codon:yes stop_codon:yes gene_type:complete